MPAKGKIGRDCSLHYDVHMKTITLPILLACTLLLPIHGAHAADQALVNQYWSASSAAERDNAAAALAGSADISAVYQLLENGPQFSADVPVGEISQVRTDPDGVEFPYVLLVPEDYSPERAWPVEFNLHGGVNRPKPEAGESFWRNGYDALRSPDRIVVVPAAWSEAYWWFDNQADNLVAILKTVRQTYNVDDNRVILTGVSDGGTGTYFFAFKQPTEWAAFMPYIGSPGVLRNPAGRITYALSFENLLGKPFYIVNGQMDRLYPERAVKPYIDLMEQVGANYKWTVIPGGGHDTRWLPEKRTEIANFKRDNVRDPFPEQIQWVTDRTDRYNRNHWIRIDELQEEGQPGRIIVSREDNRIDVYAYYVNRFTLQLNPQEIDFSQPVQVRINDVLMHDAIVPQDMATLLKSAEDLDRSLLFTAELTLEPPPPRSFSR